YPRFFGQLITGLVGAGESSGTLEKTLDQIALFLERNEMLKNRVKKALYYPITVLIIATLLALGMLVYLVPQFETIYKSFNAPLPALTQTIVNASNVVREDWWVVLLVLFAIGYAISYLKRNSTRFKT